MNFAFVYNGDNNGIQTFLKWTKIKIWNTNSVQSFSENVQNEPLLKSNVHAIEH